MKRFRKIQVLTLISMLVLASCGGEKKEADNAAKVDSKPTVKLASVTSRPVDQTENFTATVQADVLNNIAPAAPVRIDRILVEAGDRVQKGQKLVQMDSTSLFQAKVQLELAEVNFSRIDELYKVGGTSLQAWDAQKANYDIARATYNQLKENTFLVSPINGVITKRNYDNGDMYSNGNPVLVVEQLNRVKLMVNVSESYFTAIQKGLDAQIQFDVYGDEVFNGKVHLIHPAIDATTRTFPVEVILANADQRVRPGMFARVELSFGVQDNVVVPDQAIVKQMGSGERFVYVYENGKVYYRKVELGRRLGSEYELISGVKDGAQVVVAGHVRLSDGVEVNVEK